LHPRCDRWQKLHSFSLVVEPEPANLSYFTDFDGNNLIKLWFTTAVEELKIHIETEVETYKDNPFDYLLESWALKLPYDYSQSLVTQLQPYLKPYQLEIDPVIWQLAQEICHEVQGNVLTFLSTLNEKIYSNCTYIIRETGEPMGAGITWNSKEGSCRDFVVLFMEVCRAVSLGTRFVSGYQEGDPDKEERDLHAWVEVYLPGGGWRGYDPTHGLAVSDRHIALAASPIPKYTAPVEGHVTPLKPTWETGKSVESQMETHISIKV
jgi:transglutaminase-like putative cysteine protease